MLQIIKKYPLSLLCIALVWYLSIWFLPPDYIELPSINFLDKWTHFVMYGSLTSVIWFEYIRRKKRQPSTTPNHGPSPVEVEGGKASISNQDSLSEKVVTSSLPLHGEGIPVEQERGHLLIGGILCPIIMGGLIELAQAYLTTCRSGDIYDFFCNSLGVLLGCLIGLILRAILRG